MSDKIKRFCPLDGGHCPSRKGGTVFSHNTVSAMVGNAGILSEGGHSVVKTDRGEVEGEDVVCRFWDVKACDCRIMLIAHGFLRHFT